MTNIPALVTGQVVTQSDWQTLRTADDALRIAMFGGAARTNRPFVRVCRSITAQSILPSTDTDISFDTLLNDTDTMWSGGTPTQVTIKTAGLYVAFGQARWASSTAGNARQVAIQKNNVLVAVDNRPPVGGVASPTGNVISVETYAINDSVQLNVWQDTGLALNTRTDARGCSLTVLFLGPA